MIRRSNKHDSTQKIYIVIKIKYVLWFEIIYFFLDQRKIHLFAGYQSEITLFVILNVLKISRNVICFFIRLLGSLLNRERRKMHFVYF